MTACVPRNFELEYFPDDDELAGSLSLSPRDGGKASVLFEFQLADTGPTNTSAEDVVRYVEMSEYGAIADPRSGLQGYVLDIIDANGRRGAIVRWQDPNDANSAEGSQYAFGAFLSDGVVVLFDIEKMTSSGLHETLEQVLSIKARRQRS